MQRRQVLLGTTSAITGLAGCSSLSERQTTPECDTRHEAVVKTKQVNLSAKKREEVDLIRFSNLSDGERQIVQTAIEEDEYRKCPAADPTIPQSLQNLEERVGEHRTEDMHAYLGYKNRTFAVALRIEDVLTTSLPDTKTITREGSPAQESGTESTIQASLEDLNPTASVVTQPSNESPAEVELALENTLTAPVSVYPRSSGLYALEFLSPLSGEVGEIMLHPETDRVRVYNGEIPESPVDGCWRVIDTSDEDENGPYLAGINYPKEVEIEPGEKYSVLHRGYYLGPDSHCFPADTYKTTTDMEIGEEERTPVDLTYKLEVTSEGHFEASVEYDE